MRVCTNQERCSHSDALEMKSRAGARPWRVPDASVLTRRRRGGNACALSVIAMLCPCNSLFGLPVRPFNHCWPDTWGGGSRRVRARILRTKGLRRNPVTGDRRGEEGRSLPGNPQEAYGEGCGASPPDKPLKLQGGKSAGFRGRRESENTPRSVHRQFIVMSKGRIRAEIRRFALLPDP